ncbi:MAG: lipid II:glycine glycyltransferase FemX [Solirubrobacteraceae bacterium]
MGGPAAPGDERRFSYRRHLPSDADTVSSANAGAVSVTGGEGSLHGVKLDPLGDVRWGEFVSTQPDASIFHHPEWLALIRRQYGYRFSAWCVLDGAGAIVAGLPVARIDSWLTGRRLVAVPFSDECSPLIEPRRPRVAEALAQLIHSAQAKAGVPMQIRGPVVGLQDARSSSHFLQHRLELAGPAQDVMKSAKPAIRRGVAKAQREALITERATGGDALEDFYRLHLRTRHRQGVPTQPKRFILALAELFQRQLGFVLLTRHHGRAIAAAVFLIFNGRLVYKYGASDERFLSLRPNNLLFYEAIRWGTENSMRELDFGRTDTGNTGLASFKRGWGSREQTLSYTYLGTEEPPASRRSERILSTVIRATPPSAGRAIGAVLYRHVG